jgi:Arc/MetJ-type ribon-helix-helix transcriptional regulator
MVIGLHEEETMTDTERVIVTEKVTINMSVVDLGKIDVLVDEGFYSSRTDFIRTAIRNLLGQQNESVQKSITRRTMAVGALIYNQKDLEGVQARGEVLDMRLVGLLVLADDITPDLALATIKSLKVNGVFRASEAVKTALADRIQ